MCRKAKRVKGRAGRKFALIVLLGGLLSGLALLPLISRAQSGTSDAPVITGQKGSVTTEGFTLTPGNVDTENWSERNKRVVVNFSLEREDGQMFRELRVEDIKAELNEDPVTLRPDSLTKRRDSDAVKILFMIDRSGSMLPTLGSGNVDKLSAAKQSLRHIIQQMGANDQALIAAFDTGQDQIVGLTSVKSELYAGIDSIRSNYKDTSLYGSIKYALDRAKLNGIKIIVFLSDGMEDTDAAKAAKREGTLTVFKDSREKGLGQLARESGVRIFSIAVGEQGDQETLRGVDFNSLKKISDASNGGTATLIDIPELNRQTGGNPARLNERLTAKLKDVLVEIKKNFSFAYGLEVALPELQEGDGEFRLNFAVGILIQLPEDKQGITIPMLYTYTWDKESGPPIFSPGRVLTPTFIDIVPPVDWSGLIQIYFLLLSPLVLLALLPSVAERVAAARELNRMNHAIEAVRLGSPLQGKQCPNESGPGGQLYSFKAGDAVLVCPKCHTPHHLSCWEYNQHQCMNRVCEYQFVIPARVLAKYGIAPETRKQFV